MAILSAYPDRISINGTSQLYYNAYFNSESLDRINFNGTNIWRRPVYVPMRAVKFYVHSTYLDLISNSSTSFNGTLITGDTVQWCYVPYGISWSSFKSYLSVVAPVWRVRVVGYTYEQFSPTFLHWGVAYDDATKMPSSGTITESSSSTYVAVFSCTIFFSSRSNRLVKTYTNINSTAPASDWPSWMGDPPSSWPPTLDNGGMKVYINN